MNKSKSKRASQYPQGVVLGGKQFDAMPMSEFINSLGRKVMVTGVPPMLLNVVKDNIESQWKEDERELPVKPTYTTRLAGGGVQEFPHDETTVQTKEEKEQWSTYLALKQELESEQNTAITRALVAKGVVVDEETLNAGDWIRIQEHIGVRIPTDSLERKYHYVMTEIINIPNDLMELTKKIMSLSGVSQEMLAAADESFRDKEPEPTTITRHSKIGG